MVAQLSKLLRLRVIKVVDVGKHGRHLSKGPADLLVDSHDPDRAIEIVRRVTENKLRFSVDTSGKQTAELLQRCLGYRTEEKVNRDAEAIEKVEQHAHLVGLTGLPRTAIQGVTHHAVPIKVFHEVQEIGEPLMRWLEILLRSGKITPPVTELIDGGLESVNDGLDRMRRGEVCGRRLVVVLP